MISINTASGRWVTEDEFDFDDQLAKELTEQLRLIDHSEIMEGRRPTTAFVGGHHWEMKVPEKHFHDFRVVNPRAEGRGAEVWMDGQKLKGVRSVSFDTEADGVNHLRLELTAGSLNKEDAKG